MSTLNERAGKALAGRWRRGMWALPPDGYSGTPEKGGWLVSGVRDGQPLFDFDWYGGMEEPMPEGVVPDMSCPATRGAFLDVVRECYAPGVHLRPDGEGWACFGYPGPVRLGTGHTEAGALVAALVAALEAKQ
jgi:hypothetical protein